jgi:DNA-binding NarL/FixJ family response regulator
LRLFGSESSDPRLQQAHRTFARSMASGARPRAASRPWNPSARNCPRHASVARSALTRCCAVETAAPLSLRSVSRSRGYAYRFGKNVTPNTKRIRVLSVDDHPLLREGVAAVLEAQTDMELVGEAANGAEAIDSFRSHRPDVTLMDLRLPDMSGIDAIKSIRAEFPEARIIVLTTYDGDVQALAALRAGAAGYLLKRTLRKDLLDTIRAVHLGKRRIPPDVATGIAEHATEDALSARELAVLQRVAAGNSNKMIAQELDVSENTVNAHMKSILAKLGAHDRTHAVIIAIKRGMLEV